MNTRPEPITTKFKKSTAKFVRSELRKTKYSMNFGASFALEIGIAVALGLGFAFGYVHLIQ